MLDIAKRYKTRDGSRRNLEIETVSFPSEAWWRFRVRGDARSFCNTYKANGEYRGDGEEDPRDLVEEDAPKLRLEDFPLVNGKRRGVLVSVNTSEPVVVLCDDAPGKFPLRGYTAQGTTFALRADGVSRMGASSVLRPAPKPKRKVWLAIVKYPTGAEQALYATDKADLRGDVFPGRLITTPVQVEFDDD